MPKQRISTEMIINAAFKSTRLYGAEFVMAKKIADVLSCSVLPIYSYFENMEEQRRAVEIKARSFINDFLTENMNAEAPFHSIGIAWTKLAQNEPHIVRAFISSSRDGVMNWNDFYHLEVNEYLTDFVSKSLGIPTQEAKELNLNMYIFTIGLASICASASLMSPNDAFNRLNDAYKAFSSCAKRGEAGE